MALGRKEEKQQAKAERAAEKESEDLHKKGLDLDRYGEQDLRSFNIQDIRSVNGRLAGSGFYSFGSLLQGNSDTRFLLEALKAQIDQTWILIRQNEQIIRQNGEIIRRLDQN